MPGVRTPFPAPVAVTLHACAPVTDVAGENAPNANSTAQNNAHPVVAKARTAVKDCAACLCESGAFSRLESKGFKRSLGAWRSRQPGVFDRTVSVDAPRDGTGLIPYEDTSLGVDKARELASNTRADNGYTSRTILLNDGHSQMIFRKNGKDLTLRTGFATMSGTGHIRIRLAK